MKRVFVFQDFKSQKFWSIDVRGTDVIVNYGKLGTDGQTQVKNFSSAGEAEKAAGKLIAEKTKKRICGDLGRGCQRNESGSQKVCVEL